MVRQGHHQGWSDRYKDWHHHWKTREWLSMVIIGKGFYFIGSMNALRTCNPSPFIEVHPHTFVEVLYVSQTDHTHIVDTRSGGRRQQVLRGPLLLL